MSNLVINDLEYNFSGDATQLSREDQAMTIGGGRWTALGHGILYLIEFFF